jgi:hypothetical protein
MMLFLALPDPEHSSLARLILTSAYVISAWLWWRAGTKTATVSDSFLWRLGALLLFLLAMNKFFNLRLLFEGGMRAIAKSGNWYNRRQPVQFVVAVVLPLLLAAVVAGYFSCCIWLYGKARNGNPLSPGSKPFTTGTGVWRSRSWESGC